MVKLKLKNSFQNAILNYMSRFNNLNNLNTLNYSKVSNVSFDADALAYITAVETADGQSLEYGVKTAINSFIVGCKVDGIWNAIKSSAILAGARTLTGALVPLKGTAPTNFNFVSGITTGRRGWWGMEVLSIWIVIGMATLIRRTTRIC